MKYFLITSLLLIIITQVLGLNSKRVVVPFKNDSPNAQAWIDTCSSACSDVTAHFLGGYSTREECLQRCPKMLGPKWSGTKQLKACIKENDDPNEKGFLNYARYWNCPRENGPGLEPRISKICIQTWLSETALMTGVKQVEGIVTCIATWGKPQP